MSYIYWSPEEEEILFEEIKEMHARDSQLTWKSMISNAQLALQPERRRPSVTSIHHIPPGLRTRLLELTGRTIGRLAKNRKSPEPGVTIEDRIEAAVFSAMEKALQSDAFVSKLADAIANRSSVFYQGLSSSKIDLVQYAPAKVVPKDGRPLSKVAVVGLLPDQARIVDKSLDEYRSGFVVRLDINFVEKKPHIESSLDYRSYDHVIQMVKFSAHANDKMKRVGNLIIETGGLTSLIYKIRDLASTKPVVVAH